MTRKIVILLSLFAVVSVKAFPREHNEETKTKLLRHLNDCQVATGVDPALLDELSRGRLAENDYKFDAYLRCIFARYLNTNGSLNADKVKAQLPERYRTPEAFEAVDSCAQLEPGPETARKAYKCLLLEVKKYKERHQ